MVQSCVPPPRRFARERLPMGTGGRGRGVPAGEGGATPVAFPSEAGGVVPWD